MSGDYSRPDPELLLRTMKEDAEKERKGKLKVFFGMAAGVGKTYAMLDAAQRLIREGADLVIGYIENARKDRNRTARKRHRNRAQKKDRLPGVEIGELDIDSLLAEGPRWRLSMSLRIPTRKDRGTRSGTRT
jgi:two-component system sensor histidine kinase KdpD